MKIDKKVLMGLFIVGIMVFSIFGFVISYGSGQERLNYGDYKFTRTQLGVQTKINGQKVLFNFFPTQVEDIPVDDQVKKLLKETKSLSVTYDPEDEWAQAMAEIQYYLEQALPELSDVYVERGLTDSTEYELDEIQCADATEKVPVLYLSHGETTEITFDNNCIIANAQAVQELYRINDRLQYIIFGVME